MRRRRESFFSLPALVLMGVLISLALYLLFPRQAVFENPAYLEKPDALSIAYLEVLLRSDSDNIPLRLSLARALGKTGQLDRADQVLAPLMMQQPVPEEAFDYYLELQAQRLFAIPEGSQRDARKDQLFADAQKLIRQPYEPERILELLRPASSWLSQPRYLALLQGVQERMTRPGQRLQLAREIARMEEAQSRPGAAADALRPHIDTMRPDARVAFIDNIIRLELASGDPEAALALFKRKQPATAMSEQALTEGIRLARLAGATTEESDWIRQRANRNPGNTDYQRELLAAQLAAGQTKAALNTVRRLQETPGQLTREDRQTVANVLEWNSLPEQALPIWVSLYQETGSTQAFQRSVDLARGLFQWDTLLTLLTTGARQERLQPDGYITLADALVRAGRFDDAKARLAQGRARFPRSGTLKERLLTLLTNLRDFPGAIELLEQQPRLSDADRVQLASLYWRTRQPERALALLEFQPDDPQLAETVQNMRMDLANTLGRTDLLRRDYDRLLASGDRLTPEMEERLLNLAVLFEDYPQALSLSERLFRDTGESRFLAAIAEYQLALGRWAALKETLDRWRQETPAVVNNARYWSLQALIRHRDDDILAANEAYRTAWELAPDDENLMISWAWLKLINVEQFTDSLQALLARIAETPSPEAHPVLAYGYSALGQPRQSLKWFRRGMETRSNDIDWLLATARLMDQTGSPGTATDLRQRAAVQLRKTPSTPASRFAVYQEEGLLKLAWQALAAYPRSADGDEPDAAGFRETLAYFASSQGDALVSEALLPIPDGTNEAMRQRIGQTLQPDQETPEQQADRYVRQLDRLKSPMTAEQQRATTRDTVSLQQTFNSALQLGARWQNLGNFSVQRSGVTGQFSENGFRWQLSANTLKADASGRLKNTPERSSEASFTLDQRSGNGTWSLSVSQLPRYQKDDLAMSATYDRQWSDRITLGAGYHFQERTPDSAEAWWLTRRDRAYLNAGYTPFSRLNINAQIEQLTVESLENERLADGYGLDINSTYTVFRNDPAWTLSAGYRHQRLPLTDALPASTLDALEQPLATADLVTEEYERIGVGTRWFHGAPNALYRSTPSPRAFLGLGAGYVLSTSTAEVGVEFGLGWRVLGDDELALSGRWSSEGLDGNGRTEFNLTYTIYPGR
ncbi:MAG: tetratricopeptide repeat protein [Marinobacter sp.]|jgi:tetratricopeptide (TPR) repeat protein|uniref:tetratricopeptide repeat protein n=1 Tax=Marinobacter sp. TaxID=50741 RepID=UPI0032D94A0F